MIVCCIMSGLFFNDAQGVTHSIELSLFDGVSVWRAIVDGHDIVFFDCDASVEARELLNCAVDAWGCDFWGGSV